MNLSDLPTPTSFPPSAFNYERPRHFIQSQPAFQVPSYECVLREAQENQNHQLHLSTESPNVTETQSHLNSTQTQSFSQTQSEPKSVMPTQAQFQSLSIIQNQRSVTHSQIQNQAKLSTSLSSFNPPTSISDSSALSPLSCSASVLTHSAPTSSSPAPTTSSSLTRPTMRSTITLTPRVPSVTGLGSATLPANQDTMLASAAYLCSVLPSQSSTSTLFSSKLSPNSNLSHHSPSHSSSPLSPSSPLLPMKASSPSSLSQQPLIMSPSLSGSTLSSPFSFPQPNTSNIQNMDQPAVVSLPASYKGTPNT